MKKIFKFWKVVLFDIVGVALMLLALATGWLPGPGGIPLFIIGLSILAIHHEWAEKHFDKIKILIDQLGDIVFVSNKKIQIAYDVLSPILISAGTYVLWHHNAAWQIGAGIGVVFLGCTLFMGNRKRFQALKRYIKNKK